MSDIRNLVIYQQMFNLLKERFGEEVTDNHVMIIYNVSVKMKEFGRQINIYKLFEEIRNLNTNEDLEEWFNSHVYGDSINKRIEEAKKHDPIKSRRTVDNLSYDDAINIVKGDFIKNDTDFEIAILDIEDRIVRDIRENYIKRRGKYRSDGTLDRALTGNEIEKINREAMRLVKSNSDIRQLHLNNTSYKQTAMIMNEKAVDFKYKIEQLKEDICNTFRCTPESFDIWFQLVKEEDRKRVLSLHDPSLYDPVFETRKDIYDTMKYYSDVLVKSDVPKGQDVYVSKLVNNIDRIEEEGIARSSKADRDMLERSIANTNIRTLRQYNIKEINGVNPFKSEHVKDKDKVKTLIQRVRVKR